MDVFNKVSFVLILSTSIQLACTDSHDATPSVHADPKLAAHILDCEDITEKAAAHLKAVVEFQKLEIAGRKAHVFKQCMRDRGYIESPAWLEYHQKIAKESAKENQVSVDEAIENLRRLAMKQANGEADKPIYWVLKQ